MRGRTPSGSTICRWNISSVARWPITWRTCCSMPMRTLRSKNSGSTGWPRWSRSRMRGSAMVASGGWPRASSIRWRRSSCPPWATACATSTACSNKSSRMDGSRSSRTIGWPALIRGKCGKCATKWKSILTARTRCARAPCARSPASRRASSEFLTIGRWWASGARPSIRYGCGPPERRIISTSRPSATASSSGPWPRRSRPNP